MDKHGEFLEYVAQYVKANPAVAARVTEHVSIGLAEALAETQHRASDMEVALCQIITARKLSPIKPFILQKLKKWHGKTSLRWDETIAAMEQE